jgi:methyltransferase
VSRGAIEIGAGHYPVMVALHSLFLVSCLAEVWLLDRRFRPALGWPMLILLALSMLGRYWVMATLGRRWTTRVLFLPGQPRITRGPFRWLRHPNYAVVVCEIFALPLVHTAWLTAVVFSLANGLLLRERIGVEEAGLRLYNEQEPGPEASPGLEESVR